jgi:hypothetical protein
MKGCRLRGGKPKIVWHDGCWNVAHFVLTRTDWLVEAQAWAWLLNDRLDISQPEEAVNAPLSSFSGSV